MTHHIKVFLATSKIANLNASDITLIDQLHKYNPKSLRNPIRFGNSDLDVNANRTIMKETSLFREKAKRQ